MRDRTKRWRDERVEACEGVHGLVIMLTSLDLNGELSSRTTRDAADPACLEIDQKPAADASIHTPSSSSTSTLNRARSVVCEWVWHEVDI